MADLKGDAPGAPLQTVADRLDHALWLYALMIAAGCDGLVPTLLEHVLPDLERWPSGYHARTRA